MTRRSCPSRSAPTPTRAWTEARGQDRPISTDGGVFSLASIGCVLVDFVTKCLCGLLIRDPNMFVRRATPATGALRAIWSPRPSSLCARSRASSQTAKKPAPAKKTTDRPPRHGAARPSRLQPVDQAKSAVKRKPTYSAAAARARRADWRAPARWPTSPSPGSRPTRTGRLFPTSAPKRPSSTTPRRARSSGKRRPSTSARSPASRR